MSCKCGALVKAIDAYLQKADGDLGEALQDAGFISSADTVAAISELEERIAEALKDQTGRVLGAVERAEDLQDFAKGLWPKFKQDDGLGRTLNDIFFEEFSAYVPGLITGYITKIDPELVVAAITKRTTAWIKDWSAELADIMKLNSHTEIESILVAGLEKGQGVAEFARSILDSGIRDEYYKARRVALTEVLTAHSVAQQEALIQSPAVEEKAWAHTGEHKNKPRENHVAMNGKRAPKDKPFTLKGADGGTYFPMFPRDTELPAGERINCHCIHQGIASEEVLGLPLEERKKLQQAAIDADDGEWEKELDAKNRAKAGIG